MAPLFDIAPQPKKPLETETRLARAMRSPAKVAARLFTIEAAIVILLVAPVAIYAAATLDKSTLSGLGAQTGANGLSNGLVGWWTFDGPNMVSSVADTSGVGS